MQRHSLAAVADHARDNLWIPHGKADLGARPAGVSLDPDCSRRQQLSNCGHGIAGSVLGSR